MFPNWTYWKTVKGILFILTTLTVLVPPEWQQLYTTIIGSLGAVVVVLSGTPIGPTVAKAAAKVLPLVLLGALVTGETACTASQIKSATDASGAICQIVVQATDPALVPLCVTAQQLAEAIETLVGKDGGVGAAPSSDAIYQYLSSHGARPVGGTK
jgi:hypothetical protein